MLNLRRTFSLMEYLDKDNTTPHKKIINEAKNYKASVGEFTGILETIKNSYSEDSDEKYHISYVLSMLQNQFLKQDLFKSWLEQYGHSDPNVGKSLKEWSQGLRDLIENNSELSQYYWGQEATKKTFKEWLDLLINKAPEYFTNESLEEYEQTAQGQGFDSETTEQTKEVLQEILEGTYQERVIKTDFTGEKIGIYFPYKNIIEANVLIDFNFIDQASEKIIKNFISETSGDEISYDEFINTDAYKMYTNKLLVNSSELSQATVVSKYLVLPLEFKKQADIFFQSTALSNIFKKLIGSSKPANVIEKIADLQIDKDKIENFLQQRGLGVKNSKDVYGNDKQDKITNIELSMDSSERNSLFVKLIETIINDFDKSIGIEIGNGKITFKNLERIDTKTFKTTDFILKLNEQQKRSYDFSNVKEIQFVDTTSKMIEYLTRNVDKLEYDNKQKQITTPGVYYSKGMLTLVKSEMNG